MRCKACNKPFSGFNIKKQDGTPEDLCSRCRPSNYEYDYTEDKTYSHQAIELPLNPSLETP